MNNIPPPDPLDLASLRLELSPTSPGPPPVRPPRHRPGEWFLKRPISYGWWSAACRLPGQALAVASVIRLQSRFGPEVRLGLAELGRDLGIHPSAARRALKALGQAGLVRIDRPTGGKPIVTILDRPGPTGRGRSPKPLFGPIPWSRWEPACRLPHRALRVASALWLQIGGRRGRQATHEFGLGEWSGLGLTRFSAA